jgi:hypothetical protein
MDAAEEAGDEESVFLLRREFRELWHQVKEFARCQHNVQLPHEGGS